MQAAAADLEFEKAAKLRDEIRKLQAVDLGMSPFEEPNVNPKQSTQTNQMKCFHRLTQYQNRQEGCDQGMK